MKKTQELADSFKTKIAEGSLADQLNLPESIDPDDPRFLAVENNESALYQNDADIAVVVDDLRRKLHNANKRLDQAIARINMLEKRPSS